MGVVLDTVLGALESLMSISDVPGLPSTPALAGDTVIGNKDPSWDEVGTAVAKDAADLAVPGLGTLGEAGIEYTKETTLKEKKKRKDLLEDIMQSAKRDPYQEQDPSQ